MSPFPLTTNINCNSKVAAYENCGIASVHSEKKITKFLFFLQIKSSELLNYRLNGQLQNKWDAIQIECWYMHV